MSAYKGRVALVTGASSGIGAAIAKSLVKDGLIVIGGARRVDRIQALADGLKGEAGRLIPRKLDVTKGEEITELYKWADEELGGVDVLINNAAVLNFKPFELQSLDEMKNLMETNVLGVVASSREAINSMKRRGVQDGYIININSYCGHHVPRVKKTALGIYPSSKFAVTALCKTLRHYINEAGLKTRVMSISPGAVRTDMIDKIVPSEGSRASQTAILEPEDISKTVSFALNLPPRAEILELTITPTGTFVGDS